MATTVIDGNAVVQGDLIVNGDLPETARQYLAQEGSQVYALPLESWRIWDAYASPLPAAGASDDLGLYAGAAGTGSPYIGTGNVRTTTISRKARITFTLPPEYVAGASIFIRAVAGMLTTISDNTATIDFSAYEITPAGSPGATVNTTDLVNTAATTINSLTWANKDFEITATGLAPGDTLDILATIAIADTATGTNVIGAFIPFICLSIKG